MMIWIPVMRRVFPTNGNMALSTHNAGSLEAFTLKVSEALARSDGVPTEAEKGGAECGKKQNARDRERTREKARHVTRVRVHILERLHAAEDVLFQPLRHDVGGRCGRCEGEAGAEEDEAERRHGRMISKNRPLCLARVVSRRVVGAGLTTRKSVGHLRWGFGRCPTRITISRTDLLLSSCTWKEGSLK